MGLEVEIIQRMYIMLRLFYAINDLHTKGLCYCSSQVKYFMNLEEINYLIKNWMFYLLGDMP